MTDLSPEDIARGLTEAQAASLIRGYTTHRATWRILHRLGLVDEAVKGGEFGPVNDLGRAVAAALAEMRDE